ncbi:sensor histidine kinase KdpD [Rhizobium sp. KVB221]|uniref:histidine kinase n=1 Tax=Rhizobium setariae TaxID=2801340 RepID=A0A937CKM6_9HYPH|nr:sensor histidine kinase KdpD [Rhizobium setariae]MBL0372305.1 sensor histidine kinase KdpD [Rhizobium setariae]
MADRDRDSIVRPDPDALLALAGRESRGKLTIFLGAAPGVGKTYAMLARARGLKASGADIVIGYVETHGRSETAELLSGLEILPRRQIDYRGRVIEEFDLDAALARKPKTIVVDELAHTNAEDCRHPKRHQDIEELLEAGINVWTALNIQHLDSLSDVVSRIAGITVREIVPDSVVNNADEVILIDLPTAELIERLHQGKVYLPDNARRATEKFFRVGNLTALREMALRRTADRVDDQMVDYLRQNAIEGPWQSAERLLVCIAADGLAEKVIRTASRLALSLNAPWIVLHVERPDRATQGETVRSLDEAFRLAERLGAETRRLRGNDFVVEILKLARKEHVTQIVIGRPHNRGLTALFRQSLADALINKADGIGIHLITDSAAKSTGGKFAINWRWKALAADLAPAVVTVAAATFIGMAIKMVIPLPNVSLIYLLAVVVSAIRGGYRTAFFAALLSALVYNFSFIDPIGTLSIAGPHEVFAFVIFVITAIVAGGIASRIRDQAAIATERARVTEALYDLSSKLSGTARADDVVWAAVSQLNGFLRRPIVLLLPRESELEISATWPPDSALEVIDTAAARWTFEKNEAAGAGTGTLPSSAFQFRPLMSPQGVIGVCGFRYDKLPLDSGEERVFGATIHQAAIAIDRARLSKEAMEQTARLASERFRSALLSSISHDLRTPLATITGSVTSLRQFGDRMTPESRDDLLISIEEESGRLARFVANLLDMTRIEAGTVNPKHDWVDLSDVIRDTTERARKYFPGSEIETSIAADMPLVHGDSVLLGQVLFNLIDNAVKYAGDEPISIYSRRDGDCAIVSVTDQGKGIPEKDLEKVFEKFFRRGGKTDGGKSGTGLGLAIARGFVEAMGGTIKAESPAVRKRGTRFTLRFPVPEQPRLEDMNT